MRKWRIHKGLVQRDVSDDAYYPEDYLTTASVDYVKALILKYKEAYYDEASGIVAFWNTLRKKRFRKTK